MRSSLILFLITFAYICTGKRKAVIQWATKEKGLRFYTVDWQQYKTIVVGFFRLIVTDLLLNIRALHILPCDHSLSCWDPAY